MRSGSYSRWRRAAVATAISVAFIAGGCGTASGPDERYAQTATIELTGTSGAPLQVVTSTVWEMHQNPQTGVPERDILVADTVEVELPYKETVELAPYYRIYYKVSKTDAEESADIRMRVWLDSKVIHDHTSKLDGDPIEFDFFYW